MKKKKKTGEPRPRRFKHKPVEFLDPTDPDVEVLAEQTRNLDKQKSTREFIADGDLRKAHARAEAEGTALSVKYMPPAKERADKTAPPGKRARFWAAVREEYLAAALREESLRPGHLLSIHEFSRRFRLRSAAVHVMAKTQNWKAMARFLITARDSDRKLYEATRRDLIKQNLLNDSTINEEALVRQRQAHFGRQLQLRGMARIQDIPIAKIPVHIAADLVRLGSQLERDAVGANPKESLAGLLARNSQDKFTNIADAIGKQRSVREFAMSFVKSLQSAVAPALEEPIPNTDLLPAPRLRSVGEKLRAEAFVKKGHEKLARLRKKREASGGG